MSENLREDINFVKNELESLNMKVDLIIDMLNNFTIMLIDDDDDDEEDMYDTEDSWVPEENSWDDEEDED